MHLQYEQVNGDTNNDPVEEYIALVRTPQDYTISGLASGEYFLCGEVMDNAGVIHQHQCLEAATSEPSSEGNILSWQFLMKIQNRISIS